MNINLKTKNIANLNTIVLAGLDFFIKNKVTRLNFKNKSLCFVVGSVNAYNTGRMLFHKQAALFADEGNFLEILKTYKSLIASQSVKEAIIISASGEKDSIWEIKAAKAAGLKTTLLTCNPDSSGAKLADKNFFFKKISEPYSYNFSTYLGMILSATQENPIAIKKFLGRIKMPRNFKNYSFFTFILPDKFKPIVDMLNVKDDELFGPYSSLRAYSEGNARHAKFICESNKELVVSFGKNPYFGLAKNRWKISLPKEADFGLVLSLAYYLSGLIQASKPSYFKNGLANYCYKTGPKPYKQAKPFAVIVPGN
ncbi:MAG: hypothetical protein NTX66_03495 [Candidatus Falkowbacteria bacterium]|nr:hypothetical protein [Candidatus Falkowbacteria bacterium]